jgi:predicted glycosyltransferase
MAIRLHAEGRSKRSLPLKQKLPSASISCRNLSLLSSYFSPNITLASRSVDNLRVCGKSMDNAKVTANDNEPNVHQWPVHVCQLAEYSVSKLFQSHS